jgi:hypothetical protein
MSNSKNSVQATRQLADRLADHRLAAACADLLAQ